MPNYYTQRLPRAHDFVASEPDPRVCGHCLQVAEAPIHQVSQGVRAEGDAYMTPPWVTQLLLKNCGPITGRILEPAAGTGAMASVLQMAGFQVDTADLSTGQNFFDRTEPCDNVITNPPYHDRLAEKFAHHALEIVRPGGMVALLVRTGFIHGKRRLDQLFRPHRPDRMIIISQRILFFHRDGTPIVGQAHDHSWIVWRKSAPGASVKPMTVIWGGKQSDAEDIAALIEPRETPRAA